MDKEINNYSPRTKMHENLKFLDNYEGGFKNILNCRNTNKYKASDIAHKVINDLFVKKKF